MTETRAPVDDAERPTPPGLETRSFDLKDLEVRHSGNVNTSFEVRGYAAVYDQPSIDLGGFREVMDPRAMDEVLSTNPDVVFAWEHDLRHIGARTGNGTLTLRNDPQGLWIEARVGPYSWAKDLRAGLERRDITQGSIGFLPNEDATDYEVVDGTVIKTLRSIRFLGDVTVTGLGAYPQTTMVASAMRSLKAAVTEGRLPESAEVQRLLGAGAEPVTPDEGEPVSPEDGGAKSGTVNPELERRVADLKARMQLRRTELADLTERSGRL